MENHNKDIAQRQQQNHHDKQSENTNQIAKEIKNEDKISSIAGPKVYTTKNITSHDQSAQTNSLDRQQSVQKDKNNNTNNLNNQRVPNNQTNSRPNNYYNNAQNSNQNREHNFSNNQQKPSINQSSNTAINNTRPVPVKNTTPPPTYNGARPNSNGISSPAPTPRFDSPKNVSVPHNMSFGPKNVRAEIA